MKIQVYWLHLNYQYNLNKEIILVKLNINRINLAKSLFLKNFSDEYIIKKILNVENKYCPKCLKEICKLNPDNFGPICDCGWGGSFFDLLLKKQVILKLRKEKLNKLK